MMEIRFVVAFHIVYLSRMSVMECSTAQEEKMNSIVYIPTTVSNGGNRGTNKLVYLQYVSLSLYVGITFSFHTHLFAFEIKSLDLSCIKGIDIEN